MNQKKTGKSEQIGVPPSACRPSRSGMSRLICDSTVAGRTVAGPAPRRDTALASKCECPPFRYPPFATTSLTPYRGHSGPKSQKSRKKNFPGPLEKSKKGLKKSRKKVEKAEKKRLFLTRCLTLFRPFFNLFWPRGREAPGTFFRRFWDFGPEGPE